MASTMSGRTYRGWRPADRRGCPRPPTRHLQPL